MAIKVTPFLAPNETRELTKEDILAYCGQAFGMCYLKDDFDTIKNEPREKSIKRALSCIASGHHSGFEHVKYTFEISGISKMLAILLNNQSVYVTSEKSGRYTVLNITDENEEAIREKWQEKFKEILNTPEYYDYFYKFYSRTENDNEKLKKKIDSAIEKKAQENSRAVTSVFAQTKMIHTINIRQFSYLRYWLKKFIEEEPNTSFMKRFKDEIREFLDVTKNYGLEEEGLTPGTKDTRLSLFDKTDKEEFGENYSMNTYVSFATFAQNQRHRTLRCTFEIPDKIEYFIPKFIENDENLKDEWINDLKSLTNEDSYPQATIICMNEKGTYKDFVLKTYERFCGAAQYEIMMNTKEQLNKYLENTNSEKVKKELSKISTGARCTFGYKCTAPCIFGAKYALERKF